MRTFLGLVAASVLAGLALGGAAASPADAVEPPLLWQKCPEGPGPGECAYPTGLAVDPATGHLYVGDGWNARIDEFDPWGTFVRAFGWDVAPEGAPGDTPADELETCTTACKAGATGDGAGQFSFVQGIAVDSTGALYAFTGRNRIQKLDPSGAAVEFVWSIGAGVEQGPLNPGDRCTAADLAAGDTCGAATSGTGPRQFADRPGQGPNSLQGTFVAVGPADTLYVGDVGRVQHLSADGSYLGETPIPGEAVNTLAVDGLGALYVTYWNVGAGAGSKPDVYKLDAVTGAVLTTFPVETFESMRGPQALATDSGGHLHVFNSVGIFDHPVLLEFDSAGVEVNSFGFVGDFFDNGGSGGSQGLATSSACGIDGVLLYVAKLPGNAANTPPFVRAYGPPPDPDLCPPPPAPPTISDQFAVDVGTTTAKLRGRINPHFWPDTRYRVEYGTEDCSSSVCVSEPAAPGAALTDDVVDAERSGDVDLTGLEPGTTYHYRFVATSGGGGPIVGPDRTFTTFPEPAAPDTACANQGFRAGASAGLPDCRAYELVTPVDKRGGEVFSVFGNGRDADGDRPGYHYQASPDGSRLTYTSYRAFGDAESAPWNSQYIASRGPESGWQNQSINAPRGPVLLLPSLHQNTPFFGFSDDLCQAWLIQDTDQAIGSADNPGFSDLYRRENCGTPAFELVTTAAPLNLSPYVPNSSLFKFQGASDDSSRAFFIGNAQLTTNAPAVSQFKVYVSNAGSLRLASILPNGSPAGGNAFVGTAGRYPELTLRNFRDNLDNAVSEDGSRVFWTVNSAGNIFSSGGAGRVYLRVNPERSQSPVSGGVCTDPARACTLDVSGSVSSDAATFWKATADGSKALFTMDSGSHAGDLYSFDVATQTPTLIAEGVRGLLGAGDDLNRVYFVSTAVLDGDAAAGQNNLYFWEQDSGAEFITTLTAESSDDQEFTTVVPWARSTSNRRTRVTPDGRHLAFASRTDLTGFDNRDATTGERATEAFVYDADEGSLHCVSCAATNTRPGAQPPTRRASYLADAYFPGWMSSLHSGRVLSEDGDRLFFESYSRLSPEDVNGKRDVYQWQAEGSGDCDTGIPSFDPDAGGCLRLISTGRSSDDSSFVDASADGSDVFFTTSEGLVASDTGLFDIYDAKVGGGFAVAQDAQACPGDACQGQPSGGPNPPAVGTVTFTGPTGAGSRRPLRVSASKLRAAAGFVAKVRVKAPSGGAITIAGPAISRTVKRVKRAQTTTVTVRLDSKARRRLVRKGALKAEIRVRFRSTNGDGSATSLSLSFKKPHGTKRRAGSGSRGGAK